MDKIIYFFKTNGKSIVMYAVIVVALALGIGAVVNSIRTAQIKKYEDVIRILEQQNHFMEGQNKILNENLKAKDSVLQRLENIEIQLTENYNNQIEELEKIKKRYNEKDAAINAFNSDDIRRYFANQYGGR